MANIMNMSESNLYAVFKKITETTPVQYLNNYRLSTASERLINSNDSIANISESVGIADQFYFSKLFKQETGGNFIEYLTEVRLRNARELLKDSGLSIKEICAESGYSDPNYFSRIFKKYEGVTPIEFRERLR